MELKIKKLHESAIIPTRATQYSAGLDLYACIDGGTAYIAPGEIRLFRTGLAVEPSDTACAMFMYARSGLASKHGITLVNGVGVIDSDYRGEIQIPLINMSKNTFRIEHGMRLAQLVMQPVIFSDIEVVKELSDTQRGTGGFGSTGEI